MIDGRDIPDLKVDFSKGNTLEKPLFKLLLELDDVRDIVADDADGTREEMHNASWTRKAEAVELDEASLSLLAAAGDESLQGKPVSPHDQPAPL